MSDYKIKRGVYDKRSKYIDLKINGRLFPSWLLANFKKYKLQEIVRKAGEDPCIIRKNKLLEKTAYQKLTRYQQFISQYLDFKSPYRDILIYHGLGSGKTASAINVYNALYNYTPEWNVFVLIKAALKSVWLSELKKWLSKDEQEFRFKNIVFVHYDSPIADRQFMDAVKNVDNSKKSMYIIDEIHNFISNVYSNISSGEGKRAQTVYDYIIQDKYENPDTRVILLSGTPAINKPFELALLFNLLRPGIFPRSENKFNQMFISSIGYKSINNKYKNLFQRRIIGLVSYYIGSTPDHFAQKKYHYVDVLMSEYQQDIYTHYEDIEKKMALSSRFLGKGGSKVYKSYTRQACNFVFPLISQTITGEMRPRPRNFRVSEIEASKIMEKVEGLKAEKGTDKFMNISKYHAAMKTYVKGFDNYLGEKYVQDKNKGYTIFDDIKVFKKKYDSEFARFHKNEKKKSMLYKAMYKSSGKMTNIIFNLIYSPGPVLVYSNYVLMEGLEIFKIYLKYFRFYNYMEEYKLRKGSIGYVEYHGGIKKQANRDIGKDAFNNLANKYGEQIKIMLVSPAGTEGLSLRNVRQVHIMEPHWNEVRITQMVGRAVRLCSHEDLKVEDRTVDIFRYKSVRSKGDKWTTDQIIEDRARSKDSLIQSFLDTMKEVAVDCVLNKAHNMMKQKYKCFQFNEQSLLGKYIGPAYNKDINDDMMIDNGLNSINSMIVKIKVMKIKAVLQLSEPDEEGVAEYSKSKFYWYYDKSGVVYDYDLHYAIGKVGTTEDGLPMKLDKDTYIIDQVIPIPIL
uniref:DEAD/SNF2-like helicase n=1 Tax=Mimivirus LCMiAC01 TaxID=2506608 RepID=A0A481Z062_9VIRU|nr:MAG: DEAD/SNF2-like helicase [Mimivirus LCMiAC01]